MIYLSIKGEKINYLLSGIIMMMASNKYIMKDKDSTNILILTSLLVAQILVKNSRLCNSVDTF